MLAGAIALVAGASWPGTQPGRPAPVEEVAVLSADERQALDTIEHRLAGSSPKLAAMLAAFTGLAAGEQMPARERVSVREPPASARPRPRGRTCGWVRVLLLWLLIAGAVFAASGIAVAAGHGAGRPCTGSFALVCTERAHIRLPHLFTRQPTRARAAASRGGANG